VELFFAWLTLIVGAGIAVCAGWLVTRQN
jgi:predicted small secreted protein